MAEVTQMRELTDAELECVSGGMQVSQSVRNFVDGGAALAGSGALGYAAYAGIAVGLGTVGVAALGVGAVGLAGYGLYRLSGS